MKRMHVALFACLSLSLAAGAVAGTVQHGFSLPLNDVNNPCVAGPDGIDGSLDLQAKVHADGGVTFLQVNAKGKGADALGRKYQFGGKARFAFHDPLPADVSLRLRMISQGSADNAFLTLALHVNEQGVVTHATVSGVECRG